MSLPAVGRLASLGLPLYRRVFQPSYGFWSRLGDLLTDDPVVSLPAFQGFFAVGARSHVFYRILKSGAYEPGLAACALRHLAPDQDAIDVGANVGFFTVLMAKHVGSGRVLSIEPTPQALSRLRGNIVRNGIPKEKVVIYEGVVSDKLGKVTLTSVEGKEEYATIGQLSHLSVTGLPRVTQEVDSVTLDELVRKHGLKPGFIKIDAEGAEQWVVEGAREMLRAHRPVVLLEVSLELQRRNGCDPAQLSSLLRDLGYAFTDPHTGRGLTSVCAMEEVLLLPESKAT